MEKENKKFTLVISAVMIILFMAMLLTPLALLATTGQDKAVLEGEKQYEAPAFTPKEFFSADFQNKFELWFSTKYPLRSKFVTAYRQLQFDTQDIGFDISTAFLPKEKPNTETAGIPEEPETDPSGETVETAPPEPVPTYSDFNSLYAEINKRLFERTPVEPTGYKGTDQVIIGKSGYCYENGYINEYYGYSQKYRDCSDEWLNDRMEKLTYIQSRLKDMGKEFVLIISPSKASEYADYIPEWYKLQNTAPADYTRPVDRLRALLADSDVNYIDCAALYDEVGLDETFPVTGIHWNKLAAVEATNALMRKYEELTGIETRKIKIDRIREQKEPSGFGNGETDIFGIAYSGLSTKNAIVDEYYYVPVTSIENDECRNRVGVLLQGGSFCWDFKYYFNDSQLVKQFKQFYYNTWQGSPKEDPFRKNTNWEKVLDKIDYIVFELNEQMVCQMGCNAPRWAQADREPADTTCNDVYASLYEYLKSTEGSVS